MARPTIPRPVARQLRQEAGFGCCRCGLPIYEYHHIIPYHQDDPYPPHEMMILCPLCHDLATKGGLPSDEQWRLKAEPYNIRAGLAEGALVLNQEHCAVAVGECFIVGEGAYVGVDGEPLLAIGFARPTRSMTLSVALYDESDTLLVAIEENEWLSGDPFPWDIESDHQQLSIRRKAGDISLSIDARQMPVSIRAQLWRKGHCLVLAPDGIRFGAGPNAGGLMNLGLAGMALDLNTSDGSARIIPDPRFHGGFVISEYDTNQRLQKTIDAWAKARHKREHEIGRNGMCWCGSGLKLKHCHGA